MRNAIPGRWGRFAAVTVMACVGAGGGGEGTTGPSTRATTRGAGEDAGVVRELRADVEALAGEIGVRDKARPEAARAAARYVEAAMRRARGGRVSVQDYDVDGEAWANVCLEFPGARDPGQVVVVGAHYDTAAGAPGADDNASGVAALLALGRRFGAGERPGRTVRLVAFGTEEPPHIRTTNMGSYHYARACREAGDDIRAMLSMDMLGYYSDEPGSQQAPVKDTYPTVGNFLAFAGHTGAHATIVRARRAFTEGCGMPTEMMVLPTPLAVAARVPLGVNSSDHWSFWQFGYPGIMVTDTANWRNPNYHKPGDRPETLDYERLAQAVRGVEAVVRDWADK